LQDVEIASVFRLDNPKAQEVPVDGWRGEDRDVEADVAKIHPADLLFIPVPIMVISVLILSILRRMWFRS